MRPIFGVIFALGTVVLAGCADRPVTRAETADLTVTQTQPHRLAVSTKQQSEALNEMLEDLVQRSTRKGAITGAAVGCGIGVILTQNTRGCVGAGLLGGIFGGTSGRKRGEEDAIRRVEIVSGPELTRSLRRSNGQLAALETTLENTLAAQDRELAQLGQAHRTGSISAATFAQRYTDIRAFRADLVEALTLSERQVNEAVRNLNAARAQGQTGLEWHMEATRRLARDVASARTEVDLL